MRPRPKSLSASLRPFTAHREVIPVQCPICRSQETSWRNVDQYRLKPEGMALCETCGFISYPTRYKSKAEIIAYYRKEYRNPPQVGNIYTGERKIQYHGHFLAELFNRWRSEKRENILVTDVGSAFGLFLNWIRSQLPGSEVLGVELTTSFVRNAWHLFQVKSLPEFDDTRQYDLISSYKSLEHILDPDVELRRYITSLKEDGFLYLSVPIWFEQMKNFGQAGFDIEYYYSPNHINTWTRRHVEGLIRVSGGEVVKANDSFYEATYLIKRNDALLTADRTSLYEDPAKITEQLKAIFEASEAFQMGDYAKVLEIWPNCPSAWTAHYEMSRKALHERGFDFIYGEICEKSLAACNEDADLHFLAADICARYDQYERAIEHLNRANQLRPNMPNVFALLGSCFRALAKGAKDERVKVKFFEQARHSSKILGDIATQHKGEAMTWMMFDNANIPTPYEGESPCRS